MTPSFYNTPTPEKGRVIAKTKQVQWTEMGATWSPKSVLELCSASRWPRELLSSEDMKVDMVHRLASLRPIVDDNAESRLQLLWTEKIIRESFLNYECITQEESLLPE
jgi:hypothetical protein